MFAFVRATVFRVGYSTEVKFVPHGLEHYLERVPVWVSSTVI